ncbi:hypothetical protein [Amycolatopsis minnesotensis]|uniref:ATP synthase protein I n=1 Tax=Amycolatopsis minnesotensis TaxID=337894 RepID=A0ABN2RNY3_9PSEU
MSDAQTEQAQTGEPENPHAASVLKLQAAMKKATLIALPIVTVVAVVIATIVKGTNGLVGAVLGGVLALGSSLLTLTIMRYSANQSPQFAMAAVMGGYALKLIVLFGLMFALKGVTVIDRYSLGLTFAACVVVAATVEGRAFMTTKTPTVIPNSSL